MIINASGRCDICAYYSEWFMNRIREGYVDVMNPFYNEQIKRVSLRKEDIDMIVFCTKNPMPMMKYLDELDEYMTMYQVTLTSYSKDIEVNVPDKKDIIETIKQLSKRYGTKRVIVRYDPILLNEKYTKEYHYMMFERLCSQLDGYITTVIISFVDYKKNVEANKAVLKLIPISDSDAYEMAEKLAEIGRKHGMTLQTCSEKYDFTKLGLRNESCISSKVVFELTGKVIGHKKIKGRDYCKCAASTDIGAYNCCPHFCRYCYANYKEYDVMNNYNIHDVSSTMLLPYK